MIPILRQTAERRLALPRLDGGLNLKNGQSDVLDNQMTDCKNVWFADGVLKTRPALEEGGGVFPELTEGQTRTIRTGESTAVFNGVRYTLITETVSRDMLELPDQTVTVRFFPDTTGANVITAGTVTVTDEYAKNLISRSVLHEGNVYCYLRYDSKKRNWMRTKNI